VIEEDLMRVIEESIPSGKMLAAFNTTFIALISQKLIIQAPLKNSGPFHCAIASIRLSQR
jgi:hypothetical protein